MRMGEVEDGIYFDEVHTEWEKPGVQVIAPSFDEFLDRLLDDVNAFIRNDQNWRYLTDL